MHQQKTYQEERMMIKNMKRAFVLGLTALALFVAAPAPKALAADNAPAHTTVTVSGTGKNQKVTYKLSLDKVKATDGRIAVEYDPEVLTLVSESEGFHFSEFDINRNYSNGDSTGIAYAFVNDRPKSVSGRVLTMNFKVSAAKNLNTTVKTTIFGINNEDQSVISDVTLEDTVNVGRPLPKTPTRLRLGQGLLSFNLSWKGDPNADGYILYRSEGTDDNYKELWETTLTFNLDLYVKNNTKYYYKVASYQKVGNERIVSEPSEPVSGTIRKFFGWFG